MSPLTKQAAAERAANMERALNEIKGLQLIKSWNVFATRMFYFAAPGTENREGDGDYRLTLECPWRIERPDGSLIGSEDYGIPADDNADPNWDPNSQKGSLQDQQLAKLLGKTKTGEIINTRPDLIVQSIEIDSLGGFRLSLSGGYALALFPATDAEMQWSLSRTAGGYSTLMNGEFSEGVISRSS